jgi:hypothetical protein
MDSERGGVSSSERDCILGGEGDFGTTVSVEFIGEMFSTSGVGRERGRAFDVLF